jgi:GT2 family glycosyltransferase
MPEKIEKQLAAFTEDQIGLVYCGSLYHDDQTGRTTVRNTKYFSGYVYEKLIFENFIGSTSFPLLRKQALDEVGGFDPLMKSAQDFDVWLRLAKKWKIAYVTDPLVLYYAHGGERITTTPIYRIEGQRRIIEKNADYLEKDRRAWWYRHIKLTPEYAQNRQLKVALGLWSRAALKRPGEVKTNVKILYGVFCNYFSARKKA